VTTLMPCHCGMMTGSCSCASQRSRPLDFETRSTHPLAPSSAERWDACPGAAHQPLIAVMGCNANWPNVKRVFNLAGPWSVWQRHVKLITAGYDLYQLQGLRGPGQVWWVDWIATQEMASFAAAREFKKATVEECRDVVAAIFKG
jgi:hypothetical protein